jgi:tetratricopeptide (TPR) repeat protein
MEKEAKAQMFVAEQYFERDSFNLALYGDGGELGFIDIIDEYSVTQTANLASYYAGISFLHIGEYESAIEHLKGFESDDQIISQMALGAIGDAYSELEEYDKSFSFYMKAAEGKINEFTSPIYLMKAALIQEHLENFNKAIDIYERVKKEHPKSSEARHIDKYITRAKGFLNN